VERNCFLVDLMLMRLGRWLRLLGQDVANPEGISDDQLLARARKENRTIITRDKELFQVCRGADVPCILIRSSKISDQLMEMSTKGVLLQLDPKRCTLCNSLLLEIESNSSRKWECPACKKLYWQGGHWEKMERMLESIRSCKERDAKQYS
jgi:uncharacterized protein with PIN domain